MLTASPPDALPIDAGLPALRSSLATRRACVLQAPPGAGKTTRLPLALLDENWLSGQRIVLIAPRRLVVTSVARYLARQLDEAPGERIGYRIRFEQRVSAQTRLEVVTTGMYLRMLQQDPALAGVGLVIFDEFHERSLEGDLALALSRQSQQLFRDDLRLLIMSATLDAQAVTHLLTDEHGPAPLVTVDGRSFPVSTHYLNRDADGPVSRVVADGVRRALREESGSVLVFLPGQADIRATQRALEQAALDEDVMLTPLYGDLSMEAQQTAIAPALPGKRKVVLATGLAESSLTLPDIRIVVDSGLSRAPRFDPVSGLTRLVTVPASRASADQRRGRAGRVGPGVCYRLFTESGYAARAAQAAPEIQSADLAPLLLELALWGAEANELAWLTPPPSAALSQARELLRQLKALDDSGQLTDTGRAMANLPLHPRLAHMVLAALPWGAVPLACRLAALLSERDILRHTRDSDLQRRLLMLGPPSENTVSDGVDRGAIKRVMAAVRQIERLVAQSKGWRVPPTPRPSNDDLPGILLALAYPDRIAQARPRQPQRFLLSNGRGAVLDEADSLVGNTYLVAAELDGQAREARIFLAAAVSQNSLETCLADTLSTHDRLAWDDASESVLARRETRLGELVLHSSPLTKVDAEQWARGLCEGIRRRGIGLLPWTDSLRHWQQRVQFLHRCQPTSFPDLSDAALTQHLEDWLPAWMAGMSRLSHLSRLDLSNALRSQLNKDQQRALDSQAPPAWTAPTGTGVSIIYPDDGAPYSEVRLQEVFGQRQTPRVAHDQAVVLHLLSPARRPVAVTDNLERFWQVGYPDVRKDMRGRYPKHPWPENPLEAEPTRRAKPRGT